MRIVPLPHNEINTITYICNYMANSSLPYFWLEHRDEVNKAFLETDQYGVPEDILESFLSRLNAYLRDHEQEEWEEFSTVLRKAMLH